MHARILLTACSPFFWLLPATPAPAPCPSGHQLTVLSVLLAAQIVAAQHQLLVQPLHLPGGGVQGLLPAYVVSRASGLGILASLTLTGEARGKRETESPHALNLNFPPPNPT